MDENKPNYPPPDYNQPTYIHEETRNGTAVCFGNVYTNATNTSQNSINFIPPVYTGNPINFSLPPSYLKSEPAVQITTVNLPASQSVQRQAVEPLPSSYAAIAWISCLCCFWPFGLIAVYYSNKVNSALSIGDRDKAISASKKAKVFSIISIVIGVNLIWIIYLINKELTRSVTYTTYRQGTYYYN
ncbi:trafficking regulator of GLUT4 1 [Hydra vulgaris]|uniref:trafficking regulator of GLUT4 1 n=1 Tax=Hydra vulgaris TaxID=6087 RepID=UPI0006410B14|nr:trafficking regulator of GLUT4 1 [Hydra vulgaris]